MNKVSNLKELLHYQLTTIFDAENQLARALPIFERNASNIELKKIFSLHLTETKMQLDRISGMAQDLNFNLKGKTCNAMEKLIKHANKFCDITGGQVMKDTGLIVYTQQIEHYEIGSYTNLIHYAKLLDYKYLANFLQLSKAEEKNTYKKLKDLTRKGFKTQTRNYFAA